MSGQIGRMVGGGDAAAAQRKTSAEIINEARLAIRESQMAENNFAPQTIKPLQTQRPFTPRDKERLLFGRKNKTDRPPSSFSLRYLQTEPVDLPRTPPDQQQQQPVHPATPAPGATCRHRRSGSLTSDGPIFNIGVQPPGKVRLPSLDAVTAARPLQKRKQFRNTTSLDNLPEEGEPQQQQQVGGRAPGAEQRKAFSSPLERTERTLSPPLSPASDDQSGSPFGRPSAKQRNLSQCLLLGPQHLDRIFENRRIVESSETLFTHTGYFTRQLYTQSDSTKSHHSILLGERGERTVESILADLNGEDNVNVNEKSVEELLAELYRLMEERDMLNGRISSKLKIQILKGLYRFVESKDDSVLISIAKVILALRVTGNNLSGVCKLIFKVAKNDKNDNLFIQKNVLELFVDAVGRSSPLDDAEACVYGYGAVKFLTMNPKLLKKILNMGILQLMVLHIKIINSAKTDKTPMSEQTNHVLYQLTGALRNLVSEEHIYDTFISCGTISQLCQALEIFSADLDVVGNISRILSTISTNECCCDSLVENKDIYKTFIKLFEKYPGNEEIIVRLTYTLGNIVAKIDNTRVKYFEEENSIDALLDLWKIYLERTLKVCSLKTDNDRIANGNTEDVMIKVIRVIANMVINPDIGKLMNEKYGNKLIDEFLKVLISNPFKKNDELVLSILSTLNNLSYYYTTDLEVDVFHIKQIDIVEGIIEYTKSRNRECLVETMRILGNLSRSKITRSYIAESQIFETLIRLLDKADLTLLKTTIGVFVNLMSDNKSRILFKKNGGIAKLITILTNFCEHDWLLGNLVCQVLWNYCIDTPELYDLISEAETQQLLELLADYLDEEKLFGINEQTEGMELYVPQEYLIWEEFANVATNLLEKIEYFLDTFDQIQIDESVETSTKETGTNVKLTAWEI